MGALDLPWPGSAVAQLGRRDRPCNRRAERDATARRSFAGFAGVGRVLAGRPHRLRTLRRGDSRHALAGPSSDIFRGVLLCHQPAFLSWEDWRAVDNHGGHWCASGESAAGLCVALGHCRCWVFGAGGCGGLLGGDVVRSPQSLSDAVDRFFP